MNKLLATVFAFALATAPASAKPFHDRTPRAAVSSDFGTGPARNPHLRKTTIPTPSALLSLLNGTPWTNGRGLVTGATLQGIHSLEQQLFAGMGTWDAFGNYTPATTGLGATLLPHVASSVTLAAKTDYSQPVVRDGYATLGDGGRAAFNHSTSPCSISGGDGGSQIVDTAGTGCWLLDPSERVRPDLFGGGPNATAAANCTAFQKAFAASPIVFVTTPGVYNTSCPVQPGTTNGGGLIGLGSRVTALVETNPALPVVKVNDNSVNCAVRGFALYHSSTPVSGGDGFDSGTNTGSCVHDDLFSYGNYNGFDLRSTGYGTISNSTAQLNLGNGFDISNTASLGSGSNGAVQWNYEHTISQNNTSVGYAFHCNSGTGVTGMILNPLEGLYTFANGAQGVRFLGSSNCPVQDIRLLGGFFGTDASQEVYVDSYGQSIVIDGGMAEINTMANHLDLVYLTANNTTPTVRNMEISNPAGVGIHSYAQGTTANNNKVYFGSGGFNSGSGYSAYNGIQMEGAYSQVSGGMVYGFTYGVALNGANSKVSGTTVQVGNTNAGASLCGTCSNN